MNKICVYTCITGNYDNVNELTFKEKGIDYFLFTNEKLDNIRLARKHKILGNNITSKYDITIWIDGASYIKKSIKNFIREYCDLNKYDLIGFKHPSRNCIYEEAKACVYYGKEDKEIIKKQMKFLKKEKYPENNGLIESTILIRNTKKNILDKTMNKWYDMVLNFSYRDQLSFNYCTYITKLKYKLLEISAFDNEYFGRIDHISIPQIDEYYIYFGDKSDYSKFDINLQMKGKYTLENDFYIIEITAPVSGKEISIELNKNGGLKIQKIIVDDVDKYDIIYIENFIFDNCNCFVGDTSKIRININYKKNQHLIIKIKMKVLDINDYKKIIDEVCIEKNKISQEYKEFIEDYNNNKILLHSKEKEADEYHKNLEKLKFDNSNLKQTISNVINSKSFKVTKLLRAVSSMFRKRG